MSREDFIKRLQEKKSDLTDGIAEDWKKLVANGTISKIMKQEEKYKQSGGYSELDSEEDIEK